MTTQREARAMGREIGYQIGSEAVNCVDWFREFELQNDGWIDADDMEALVDYMAGEASTHESDNVRSYSPFEFTAQKFNASRDPDAVWEAYDEGVYKGARAGAKDWIKANVSVEVRRILVIDAEE